MVTEMATTAGSTTLALSALTPTSPHTMEATQENIRDQEYTVDSTLNQNNHVSRLMILKQEFSSKIVLILVREKVTPRMRTAPTLMTATPTTSAHTAISQSHGSPRVRAPATTVRPNHLATHPEVPPTQATPPATPSLPPIPRETPMTP